MPDQPFPRQFRIRLAKDFERVGKSSVFAADQVLVVRGCLNGLPDSRLGLSVSRRVGNAVVRNRWKRLIRESFRQNRHKLPQGLDLVARPRRGARLDSHAIFDSLPRLAWRIAHQLRSGRR